MKTVLSAVAALAVLAAAGSAGAADTPPEHHHAKKHHEKALPVKPAKAEARTEHGGPPSSPAEQAETEKLNEQQLAKPNGS